MTQNLSTYRFEVVENGTGSVEVCIIGDKLSDAVEKPQLARACIDNCTHALIGLIAAEIFLNGSAYNLAKHDYLLFLFEATVVSSFIDLDHFIEARSFSLQEATNLDRRPFLHNSAFCIVIFVLLIIIKPLGNIKLRLTIAIAFIAFSTHHVRDATRRGIWIKSPLQDSSSRHIPYVGYLAFVSFIPHAISIFLRTGQQSMTKTRFIEHV